MQQNSFINYNKYLYTNNLSVPNLACSDYEINSNIFKNIVHDNICNADTTSVNVCCPVTCYQDPSICMDFVIVPLISNAVGFAPNLDLVVLDPWGILIIDGVVWVANSGSGLITAYQLSGIPLGVNINVIGALGNITEPTGLAYNSNSIKFMIVNRYQRGASMIITATRDGTIHGFNESVDPFNAILIADNSVLNCVYTGLTVANIYNNYIGPAHRTQPHGDYLYVADFFNKKIDVYNGDMIPIYDFLFIDESGIDPIPDDYSPYNICYMNQVLYVTYARQDPLQPDREMIGDGCCGQGFVNIFSIDGIFIKRLISRSVLNAPWGIINCPSILGYPANSIIISNFGDGKLNVFDENGTYLNSINDANNNSLTINYIRGIAATHNKTMMPLLNASPIYWTASDELFSNSFIGSITSMRLSSCAYY